MNRPNRIDLVIFDVYRDGHRRDYFRVLRRVLGGYVMWGPLARRWPTLLAARKLVCSTCDDYLAGFFVLALIRALLGRPTIGLSIRSETIFQRSGARQMAKRAMLRLLMLVPQAQVVTFMPYWAEPRLARYTRDWMYDLQCWDLPWLDTPETHSLAKLEADLRNAAIGRQIVVALGHQRRVKGVEYFMDLYEQAAIRERFLFVCIGPNWDIDKTLVARFRESGGVFIDRQLRDDEMLSIYALVDVIWACYRPEYDQSSGIFGRAIQLGKPIIVRRQSYLAVLRAGLGKTGYALPYADSRAAAAALTAGSSPTVGKERIGADRGAALLWCRLDIAADNRPSLIDRRGNPRRAVSRST